MKQFSITQVVLIALGIFLLFAIFGIKKKKVIFFIGPPTSGKTTAAKWCAKYNGWQHVCTEHLCLDEVKQKICLDCHQEDIVKQYQRLKIDLDRRIRHITLKIEEVKIKFNSTKGKEYGPAWKESLSLFQEVQANYFYLKKDNSKGAHNKWFILHMVKNIEENIQKIRYLLYNYQDYRS